MKKTIVLCALIAAVLAGILPGVSVGASMLPTLKKVTPCIVNYSDRTPARGDIIFLLPDADVLKGPAIIGVLNARFCLHTTPYCKRVVGIPGDVVEACDGVLLVNGCPFDNLLTADFPPVMVGEGEYFVMGDNRAVSHDSRAFGPIKESQVLGTIIWHL